jgi:hypothetical protein
MKELIKAIYLLTKEVRGLRADLKLKSNKELLLSEKKKKEEKLDLLVKKFNMRHGEVNEN